MQYNITLKNPLTHLLHIEFIIEDVDGDSIDLTLPIWRPGRYEAAYYSKNIIGLSIKDEDNNTLSWTKPDANTWIVDTSNVTSIKVSYEYFAFVMDAGNSWYGEDLLYINFINCLMFDPNRLNEKCGITVDIPANFTVGCSMHHNAGVFEAKDYYEVVDSPMLASNKLQHLTYQAGETPFHIWIHGNHALDIDLLVSQFEKFTKAQLDTFGSFPEPAYHFLLLILPYKFYHGVEHGASTVICLGPGEEISGEKLYPELLGVSSHELFHAWNIVKIRPQEMMPYDFTREITFPTGFVAEGFTTYYGDLYLSRGNVFDCDGYFKELNTLFNRHFWNYGRLNESVITSSLNLWVDGYNNGAPHKKSSIYVEGAMIALTLDLLIRKETESKKSLDDVMRILWVKHGATGVGYSLANIQSYCESVMGSGLQEFFNEYVYGTKDKHDLLISLLEFVGCELIISENPDALSGFGLRTVTQDNIVQIAQIAPGSAAEKYFSLNDKIEAINGSAPDQFQSAQGEDLKFKIKRGGAILEVKASFSNEQYYKQHSIRKITDASENQRDAFARWSGQPF